MGKVVLQRTYEYDMIECPDHISNKIIDYFYQFQDWLSDKNNKHGYWTKDCFNNDALCYGTEEFVDWLNNDVIQPTDKKVFFVKKDFQANEDEKRLPLIYF